MKRTRCAIRIAVLSLAGGALMTFAVAEGIGLSGVVRTIPTAPTRFVAVDGRCVEATDWSGPAWHYISWVVQSKSSAAVSQYMYENNVTAFVGQGDPSNLHYDLPESLPRWSRLWHSENWRRNAVTGSELGLNGNLELDVGWPMPSFSMDWECTQWSPCNGGMLFKRPPGAGPRFLIWRPIPLGFAADTLLWSACIAGATSAAQMWIKARRRRRAACPACGYDLRGLTAGTVCPECGAGDPSAAAEP